MDGLVDWLVGEIKHASRLTLTIYTVRRQVPAPHGSLSLGSRLLRVYCRCGWVPASLACAATYHFV